MSPLASFAAGVFVMIFTAAIIVGVIAIIGWIDPPRPREEWLMAGLMCGAAIVLVTIIALIDWVTA